MFINLELRSIARIAHRQCVVRATIHWKRNVASLGDNGVPHRFLVVSCALTGGADRTSELISVSLAHRRRHQRGHARALHRVKRAPLRGQSRRRTLARTEISPFGEAVSITFYTHICPHLALAGHIFASRSKFQPYHSSYLIKSRLVAARSYPDRDNLAIASFFLSKSGHIM